MLHVLLDRIQKVSAEILNFPGGTEVLNPLDYLIKDLAQAALWKPDTALVEPVGRCCDRPDQERALLKESLLVVRVELLPDAMQVVFDEIRDAVAWNLVGLWLRRFA